MEKEKQARVEVKVNFLSIDRGTGAPIVVLKEKEEDSNRILLIWIGESEAAAIQMHIEKMQLPRPMTHDLLKTMIETLEAKVTAVCVRAFEERTFYAHVTLDVKGDTIEVDCRPSDAIALALRCEAPIYATLTILLVRAMDLLSRTSPATGSLHRSPPATTPLPRDASCTHGSQAGFG